MMIGIDDDDNQKKDNKIDKTSNKTNNKIKEVTYTESVVKIVCKIDSNSIICRYDIKTKNGTSKTGTFNLKKKMSDYEEFVYEKTNDEWTKSEIYYQVEYSYYYY